MADIGYKIDSLTIRQYPLFLRDTGLCSNTVGNETVESSDQNIEILINTHILFYKHLTFQIQSLKICLEKRISDP